MNRRGKGKWVLWLGVAVAAAVVGGSAWFFCETGQGLTGQNVALEILLGCVILFTAVLLYVIHENLRGRRELEALHNAVPGAIFRCRDDADWTVLSANGSFYEFLGYAPEAFREHGGSIAAMVHPDDLQEMRAELARQRRAGDVFVYQHRMVCAGGAVKWIWIKGKVISGGHGEAELYCVFMDITELKRTERQSALNQQRYEIIMDQMQDTVLEWNTRNRSIYYSKNFERKFGFTPSAENFPESLAGDGDIPASDCTALFDAAGRAREGIGTQVELRIRKSDGHRIWCRMVFSPLRDARGQVERVIGVISDIDTQKRQLRSMEKQARMDPLTRLFNRGAAEQLIRGYIEEGGGRAALFVLDVDDFKGVNDKYGHQRGDDLLRSFAAVLVSQFRSGDVLGRIGGDEFVVFLRGLPENYSVTEKAAQLLKAVEAQEGEAAFSCSMGIALYPRDATTYEALFGKADTALYFAKRHGKECYAVYDERMSAEGA